MEIIIWVGFILLLLWGLFKIYTIRIIDKKIGVIGDKLNKLEKLDHLDKLHWVEQLEKLEKLNKLDKLIDIIELLPKSLKSQVPENLYILKIDGKTTAPLLLTDIQKHLVDVDNTYVWNNEKLIWKHITLYNEIVSFCQIEAKYPLNWSSENLDVDKFRNGDIIPEARTPSAWKLAGENKTPAWCYYDNDLENAKKYGKLYNWFAVIDPRGLAPEGWHVPTDNEWTELENLLDDDAGKKLKSKNGWENSGNGTDQIGFNAMPGGGRNGAGDFHLIGELAFFWCATEDEFGEAWGRDFHGCYNYVVRDNDECYYNKTSGASVRCIRD